LLARKIPDLAALPLPAENIAEKRKFFLKEKTKLFFNKSASYLFKKIIIFLRKTESFSQNVLKKATRLYQRQRNKENIQEDILKRKEEISRNKDYWHNIKRGLVGKVKGKKITRQVSKR